MRETANWPLAERLFHSEMQAAATPTTRTRLLAAKRDQQRDYLEQDAQAQPVAELGAGWAQFADTSLNEALVASW